MTESKRLNCDIAYEAVQRHFPKKPPMSWEKFAKIKKLSRLLVVALAELRRCERRPDITVDMGTWFDVRRNRCAVCLAGATMLALRPDCETIENNYTSIVAPRVILNPDNFDANARDRFYALNALRCGDVLYAACHMLGLTADDYRSRRCVRLRKVQDALGDVPDYNRLARNRAAWWKSMRRLVRLLRAVNE